MPSLELSIYRLDIGICIERPLIGWFAIHDVRCADLDCLKCIKTVRLHHDKVSNSAKHYSILESHEVKPAAATRTSCNCAELMSDAADLLSGLIKEFCWERTAADACTICLEDTIYMSDEVWIHSETHACTRA